MANDPLSIAVAQALASVYPFLVPEMILLATACLVFLGGAWKPGRALWACVTLAGLAVAGAMLWLGASAVGLRSEVDVYATPLVFDSLTQLMRWIALGSGVVLTLFGWSEVPERQAGDFFACLLIMVAGIGLTAGANDLVLLFLALELVSIPTYVILYLPRHDEPAQEAAMKYFLLSIFSSGLTLFGFSYLYGLTGTTNLAAIQSALLGPADGKQMPALSVVALIMIVAGLGFRITAVPFHFYAPDVYQGAPTIGAALLAFVPKVVGFAALVRLLGFVLPDGLFPRHGLPGTGLSDHVPVLFWFLAAASMTLGNLLALLQDNVRRLLAYSSVAHGGYMLMGLASAPFLPREADALGGISALIFYLIAYGVMTTGAFAVLSYFENGSRRVEALDDLAGLAGSHPGLALMMTLFLLSLIGIPLTAGFSGKFLLFFGALSVPAPEHAQLYRILALLAAINAAIGGWYYLRVIGIMYLRQALQPLESRRCWPGLATIVLCAAATLGLGVPPGLGWLAGASTQAVAQAK